jgi:hypothetical protein
MTDIALRADGTTWIGTLVASFDGTEAATSIGRRSMRQETSDFYADVFSTLRRMTGFAIMAWVYMLAEMFVVADEIAARAIARGSKAR